jgi:hypothetical protein
VKWLTKYDLDERLAAGVSEIVEDRSDLDRIKRRTTREPVEN